MKSPASTANDSIAQTMLERLREFSRAIESGENIALTFTCRQLEFDLQSPPYTAALVKQTRKELGCSQAFFAMFLGVSKKTVQHWEQGLSIPKTVACRFMDEIRRDPDYWIKRMRDSIIEKPVDPAKLPKPTAVASKSMR